ncbi:MAG: hypothetical protein Q4B17_12670 [Lautropia sp.]|nr:hypothetical protein [Lautropia sp.]
MATDDDHPANTASGAPSPTSPSAPPSPHGHGVPPAAAHGHGTPPSPPQHFQFPDDSDDDYLEDDEAGPLDEDAALATLPPLTDEDRALINKLMHSMRLLDIGISNPSAHEAGPPAPTPYPTVTGPADTLTDSPAPVAPPMPPRPAPRPVPSLRDARIVQDDADAIPMLTDVVNVQRYHPDQLPQNFGDVDWGELASQVRENVLERLLRRGDILLDAQMTQALTPVISRAVETMTRDMHDTLNRMIRDIVHRAVTEEITRLHAEMARQNRGG